MSPDGHDVELQSGAQRRHTSKLRGYPSFADFIASDSDAAVFRTYRSLSARNLLYLQSELHELEAKLHDLDNEDVKSSSFEAEGAAQLWRHYNSELNPRAVEHRKLQKNIREKLKEYHEALILESQVLALQKPTSRTLKAFKQWFNPLSDNPVLLGRDRDLFNDETDLVALAPVDTDRLHIFLSTHLGWVFKKQTHPISPHDSTSHLYYFPLNSIHIVSTLLSIILSAILLIGAIIALVLVQSSRIWTKVSLIIVFTSLFAGVVGLLTNARRAELFAGTAAYAAVLVVFVSNPIT